MVKKMLVFLLVMHVMSTAYALEDLEINRLKDHAYIERIKEEENRLFALDLERMRLELEKKKLLEEIGSHYHQEFPLEKDKDEKKLLNIKVVRIIDFPQRKEVELNIEGDRITFKEKEKKGDIFVQEIMPTRIKIEYQKKEMILGIAP